MAQSGALYPQFRLQLALGQHREKGPFAGSGKTSPERTLIQTPGPQQLHFVCFPPCLLHLQERKKAQLPPALSACCHRENLWSSWGDDRNHPCGKSGAFIILVRSHLIKSGHWNSDFSAHRGRRPVGHDFDPFSSKILFQLWSTCRRSAADFWRIFPRRLLSRAKVLPVSPLISIHIHRPCAHIKSHKPV